MSDLREMIVSNCDLAFWTEEEKQYIKNPEILSSLEKFLETQQNPNLWFLENCSKEIQDKAKSLLANTQNLEEQKAVLLRQIYNLGEDRFEDQKSFYERVQIAKDSVVKFVKDHNLKDDELLVISHCNTLKSFTAVTHTHDYAPEDYIRFDNAQLNSFEL